MRRIAFAAACAFAALFTTTASGGFAFGPAVDGFSGGSNFGIFYGGSTGDVVGFRFTADHNLVIGSLGVINDQADGVLDSPHMVGLWRDSDMALLASTTVDSTGVLIGDFFYEAITPVALTAGERYTLGAMYTATDNDSYLSGAALTLNGISNTVAVFPPSGSLGFVYPTSESAGNPGRLGPNMLIIPAPGAIALLGVAGIVTRRRRRA